MNELRLNLVTDQEFNECCGGDRKAIIRGTRKHFKIAMRNRMANAQCGSTFWSPAPPTNERDPCSCPNPRGGVYNKQLITSLTPPHVLPGNIEPPTTHISGSGLISKTVGTETVYYDKVLDLQNRSVAGHKVLIARSRNINEGFEFDPEVPSPREFQYGKRRKGSQTEPFNRNVQTIDLEASKWAGFLKLKDKIQKYAEKAMFPAGSTDESYKSLETKNELDSEWLEYTGSESSTDYMEEARKIRDKNKLFAFFAKLPVEPASWKMSNKLSPMLGLMTCLGINPFTTYINNKIYGYKIKPFSLRYIIFFLVFLLTSLINGLSWANFLYILVVIPTKPGVTFARYAEYVEFEKYWPYALYHLISFCTVAYWSAEIYLRDGKRFAEFMSRWHLAVAGVNYDPYEHVAKEIKLNIGFATVYSLVVIFLYVFNCSLVRDACGLLGLLVCRSFTPTLRIGGGYDWVRLAGLFLHIYITFAERMVYTYVLVYCKFLDNFTRRWNLRMAYTMGMLGRFNRAKSATYKYVTKVPFKKLFGEHLVIITFGKLTGKAFGAFFVMFFFVKLIDISFLAFRVITFITVPGELDKDRFEEEFLDGVYKDRNDLVRFQDPPPLQLVAASVIFTFTLLGWLRTTLLIIEPGRSIHAAFGFVRRHGYVQCTTATLIRFVLSLRFNFSLEGSFYFNPGFVINRKWMSSSALWGSFFILAILAFNPWRVTSIPVDICTRDPTTGVETCYQYHTYQAYEKFGGVHGTGSNKGPIIETPAPIEATVDPPERPPTIPSISKIVPQCAMPKNCNRPKKRAVFIFSKSRKYKDSYVPHIVCCFDGCTYNEGHFCNSKALGNVYKEPNSNITLEFPLECLDDKKITGILYRRHFYYIYEAAVQAGDNSTTFYSIVTHHFNKSTGASCAREQLGLSNDQTLWYNSTLKIGRVKTQDPPNAKDLTSFNAAGSNDWDYFSECVCKN